MKRLAADDFGYFIFKTTKKTCAGLSENCEELEEEPDANWEHS